MSSLNQSHSDRDTRVLSGQEDPPPCYSCKAASTHVTDGITPAGYRAYQCAAHVPKKPPQLWGSDPGWNNTYITIEEARAKHAARVQANQQARLARKVKEHKDARA